MKTFLLLTAFLIGQSAFAQEDCGCTSELDYIIQYYEDNLPAFVGDINEENIEEYNDLKNRLHNESKEISNQLSCYKVLITYVEYFRDNHSTLLMNTRGIDEDNAEEVAAFLASDIFKSTEMYTLSGEDEKDYPLTDIRGVYVNESGSYTIAVVPSKTKYRDFVGVVIDAKSKLWKRGQVKLELKNNGNGEYKAFRYMRNHDIKYAARFTFNNGVLGEGWFKTNLKDKDNFSVNTDDSFDFHMINDSTAYLRLPSFDAGYTTVFDSIYAVADPIIRRTPYLVIDVRNNNGGSDSNVEPLIDYTYTNPIIEDYMELYATEDHLKVWESWYGFMQEDTTNYAEIIPEIKSRIDKIKAAKRPSFIPLSEGDTTVLEVIPFPIKVAVLYDKNCASACETLLFDAMQSSKTILVGENSGGYVGYGENGNVETPCYSFYLTCTMTRYHSQRQYEVVGIPPDYLLNNDKDWIEQAIDLLIEE